MRFSVNKIVFVLSCLFSFSAFAENVCPAWISGAASSERDEQRLDNASEWISAVELILADYGLESKWLYLMLSESGGNLDAESKHGAVGPWQLTSLIARKYGCADRTDPVQSTVAAASYISKLLDDFDGDEKMAIMAYNMGGSNLRRNGPTKEAKNLAALVVCLFHSDPLNIVDKERKL
jgi:soluble lytic murein transglycosylase-like protein